MRGQYLLFIDECGTHDMRFVDPNFPLFVLVGLLVGEKYYAKTLVPRVKRFKKKYLGDSHTILHSRDIRRCEGAFAFLRESITKKQNLYAEINSLINYLRIRLFAVAIDKDRLKSRYLVPLNPYDVSLSQLLSVVCGPPRVVGPNRPVVRQIIAESRGRREDKDLQREYQILRHKGLYNYGATGVQNRRRTTAQKLFPDRIDFIRKPVGVAGLELADLMAYPIARALLKNDWSNPSAKIVAEKLREIILFP